jgi:excisionase family DNA binding protein
MDTSAIGEFLTVQQLQKLTGESESCWRKRLQRREIAFVKFGANIRVRAADFLQWCEQRTVKPVDGPNSTAKAG